MLFATGGHYPGEGHIIGGVFGNPEDALAGNVTVTGYAKATIQHRLQLVPTDKLLNGESFKATVSWNLSGTTTVGTPALTSSGFAAWELTGNVGGKGVDFGGSMNTCALPGCPPEHIRYAGDPIGPLTITVFPKWGSWYTFTTTLGVEVKSYSYFGEAPMCAVSDFSQTLVWGGITATDLAGNHVTDFKVFDEYGNDWTNAFAAPEPSSWLLLCSGALGGAVMYRRRFLHGAA